MIHVLLWTIALLPGLAFFVLPLGERQQALAMLLAIAQIPMLFIAIVVEIWWWRRRRGVADLPVADWRGRPPAAPPRPRGRPPRR